MATNMNFVKVAVLGGKVAEVSLEDGATVADALKAAELKETDGMEIEVNKRPADLEDEVYDRDIVVLVPNVEGGAN